MNILLYTKATLPIRNYGGTERVIWNLAHALYKLGHEVTLLAGKGSKCNWARVLEYQPSLPLSEQIPRDIDVVHMHAGFQPVEQPYIITQHGNSNGPINPNTVFVSAKHAENHGAQAFVHNGLDWDSYCKPNLTGARERFHFLGKAAWRVKNVKGAIAITRKANQALDVLGGYRLNFKMGFRLTLDPHVRFMGMVDDAQKSYVMTRSKGLVFPVTWHEPFGLAVTESLYFGCPVFATPYGSLAEIVSSDVGVLSASEQELVEAVRNSGDFSGKRCHEYARDIFNADVMAKAYVDKYQKVIDGHTLNESLGDITSVFKKLPYIR
ncbi:glycosyltransferase [Vibrio sp. SCSIO 43135]|uniref:Glycosyltransferase n=1 Tax=Vibrio paucivorans TaxID=2829489 RepID=A0A9X3HR24_9VIBR|nr:MULTISPECIES: glycosyltransferase [Vibrio]MCW8333611.1 glycosyltransferase [Vibrio paucivorans]USD41276.1 glycosyltransferase [Vibrio sp. SCSIO 43135]